MTVGQLVTPEGMLIDVNSASQLTPSDVDALIRQSARNLSLVAPCTTVKLQDVYSSQCSASALRSGDTYSKYHATIYYKGINSTFANQPEAQGAHEYQHAYSLRAYYLVSQKNWTPYLTARGLASDPRVGSSYMWSPAEICADDCRIFFQSAKAAAQRPKHMNYQIPDPTTVPGLKEWIIAWAG